MSDRIPKKRLAVQNIQKYDIIKKHHQFLRDDSDSEELSETNKKNKQCSKEEQKGLKIAKKYYQQLYKQYVIVDLSQYQSGKIGCRWRTEKQVLKGKGQKLCANLKCKQQSINVFQMNFGYVEHEIKKNALVKISVCADCSIKLNFKKILKRIS